MIHHGISDHIFTFLSFQGGVDQDVLAVVISPNHTHLGLAIGHQRGQHTIDWLKQ
jgi:hypothetical protein